MVHLSVFNCLASQHARLETNIFEEVGCLFDEASIWCQPTHVQVV